MVRFGTNREATRSSDIQTLATGNQRGVIAVAVAVLQRGNDTAETGVHKIVDVGNRYAACALDSSSGVGGAPYSFKSVDMNGDGKADLICANIVTITLSMLINTPMLTVNPSGNSVIVSWPSPWTNWTLQQNSDLAMTNWSASSGLSDNGTNKSLAITTPPDNLFFRLSHP